MTETRKFAVRTGALAAVLVCCATGLSAQQPPASRALTIYPPTGLPIVPVMEGWYENDDYVVIYADEEWRQELQNR